MGGPDVSKQRKLGLSRSFRYERPLSWVLALLPLGAVGGAFILPYGTALAEGFWGIRETPGVWENSAILSVAVFTVRQALLSTLAALILGLPGALIIGAGRFRFSGPIRAITSIPFAMPPILVVLGFVLFFGNAGWANRLWGVLGGGEPLRILYKPSAIILAHGFYNFPLVVRLAGDGIFQARKNYAPAAAMLGASGGMSALTVLFPLAFSSIAAASLLVFLYCFTSFAVVLVLGGGPAATTLAVEIYRYARLSLDYSSAGILALLETGIAALVFLGYLYFEGKRKALVDTAEAVPPMEGSRLSVPAFGAMVIYGLILAFLILGPLLSVPLESFLYRPSRSAPPVFSLRWWTGIGGMALPALGRSLLLAFLSATLACVLGTLAAASARGGRSPMRLCATAPLASSGIVLGLGWISLYGRDRSRSLWALVIVHAVTALPFAYNSIAEGLKALPRHTLNAASVFGAGPIRRTLTVALPLSLTRIRSAWGFAAAISLGELNAVLMLGMEEWETLPLLIYRSAGAYRYGAACAAGALLILCCAAAFLVSDPGFKPFGRRKILVP
jgi:thiamine transport system permease protein